MTRGERCERDAPRVQLWLIDPLVGEPTDLGHQPVAMFHHVPPEEHPACIVPRPDRRTAYRDRENNDREAEDDEESYAIPDWRCFRPHPRRHDGPEPLLTPGVIRRSFVSRAFALA